MKVYKNQTLAERAASLRTAAMQHSTTSDAADEVDTDAECYRDSEIARVERVRAYQRLEKSERELERAAIGYVAALFNTCSLPIDQLQPEYGIEAVDWRPELESRRAADLPFTDDLEIE